MSTHPQFPISAYATTGGIVYFARMLDKIRLLHAGRLIDEYHQNLGIGFDSRCCNFLKVDYQDLSNKVKEGASDEEALNWCFEVGGGVSEEQILVWNKFMLKRGWLDEDDGSTQELEEYKKSSGLSHREDIVTFFDYYDVDEGRKK